MPVKNPKLIDKRNKKVVERYHYWSDIQRRRFDDVLNILKWEEFFIEEVQILRIIKKYDHYYKSLLQKKPTIKQLKLYDEN